MMETKSKKILLQDLLHLTNEERAGAKVKFNIWNRYEDPIELFKTNPDIPNTQWLFWNKKRKYFHVGQIAICLVRIEGDLWLLTTVKEVTKDLNVHDGISFEGEEIWRISEFFGRVIVRYHSTIKAKTECTRQSSTSLRSCRYCLTHSMTMSFQGMTMYA